VAKPFSRPGYESQLNLPAINVSWDDIWAFCTWLNNTQKLDDHLIFRVPTEAQWEKAARGTEGGQYPWGNSLPDPQRCNFDRHYGGITAVGQFSPGGDSPYGCADMAGNVWEWTSSLWQPYPYCANDGREDIRSPGPRVRRGGTFDHNKRGVRCACRFRIIPPSWEDHLGFRVCAVRKVDLEISGSGNLQDF